jgi:ERCC4-type nuclease
MNPLKLIVDYRESHLHDLLEGTCETITFTNLPVGDYLIVSETSAVVVERKTVPDFMTSVRSNRLWDQLLRMMKAERILGYPVKRRILLLQGRFDDYLRQADAGNHAALRKHWAQLMGAYLEIIFVYNTPIIQAESDVALRAFIRILVQREGRGGNDKLPDARWYRKPARAELPVKDRKKYILAALPFVGNQLADNLITHFETIARVACASVDELQAVPKIGKKKAELIFTVFH